MRRGAKGVWTDLFKESEEVELQLTDQGSSKPEWAKRPSKKEGAS
jgi:hypothetical protein